MARPTRETKQPNLIAVAVNEPLLVAFRISVSFVGLGILFRSCSEGEQTAFVGCSYCGSAIGNATAA